MIENVDRVAAIVSVLTMASGPLFTKQTDVLPQDHLKFLSREVRDWNFPIALKLDSAHPASGNSAAEVPVRAIAGRYNYYNSQSRVLFKTRLNTHPYK